MREDTKEIIVRATAITRRILHYGLIPLIIYLGFTRTNPRPAFIKPTFTMATRNPSKITLPAVGAEHIQVPLQPHHHKQLYRRVDWRILPMLNLGFLLCIVNRTNMGNAKLFDLEHDLGLSQSQYSWALSIFFVTFIAFEIPANMIIKLVRPARWLGFLALTWGVLSMTMAACADLASLLSVRVLLGIMQAGYLPGMIYYLTLWYNREQLCTRLAICYSGAAWANAFGGIIAYGISHLDGIGGLAAWQWLFLLEGLPTVVLGILLVAWYPDSPAHATWLTDIEQSHVYHQLKLDNDHVPNFDSNGLPAGLDSEKCVDWHQVRQAFTDPLVYLHCLVELGITVPVYGMVFLLSTIIKGFGFDNLVSQALVAPSSILSAVLSIVNAYHSNRTQERGWHVAIPTLLAGLGFLLIGVIQNKVAQYLMVVLLTPGTFLGLTINVAWMMNNLVGKTKKALSSALLLSIGNLGGVIAGQMYRNSEAPQYLESHLGNGAALLVVFAVALILKLVLVRCNRALSAMAVVSEKRAHEKPFSYIT
ncbi:hypothetical protein H4R34_004448 [Dimargaris verticillata]|uniref:Major facilitator superfamily (MFS) profile domain-containing protein n=1 Tax=Dimargaris verticillata TaxID=2761393 RepID=A0A9W8EB50_9FUNG|nr:hypothetical protein H4R34_004448 [Dimargaris verticillata]